MIVLNEYEWAEEVIREHSLGNKPSETLYRVAKYYVSKGETKNQVRKRLEDFLRACDSSASIPKWGDTIDFAVKRAQKYGLVEIDYIPITDKELERIGQLDGKPIRRLAFTLLCLSKYWRTINEKADGWVSNKDSDIMKLANINTSVRRQSAMFAELNKNEMIQFSRKVDNNNVRVCFEAEGEVVMKVDNFLDLGNQYLMFCGQPYYKCETCGRIIKKKSKTGRNPKYCPECAARMKLKQSVESVMRSRKSSS